MKKSLLLVTFLIFSTLFSNDKFDDWHPGPTFTCASTEGQQPKKAHFHVKLKTRNDYNRYQNNCVYQSAHNEHKRRSRQNNNTISFDTIFKNRKAATSILSIEDKFFDSVVRTTYQCATLNKTEKDLIVCLANQKIKRTRKLKNASNDFVVHCNLSMARKLKEFIKQYGINPNEIIVPSCSIFEQELRQQIIEFIQRAQSFQNWYQKNKAHFLNKHSTTIALMGLTKESLNFLRLKKYQEVIAINDLCHATLDFRIALENGIHFYQTTNKQAPFSLAHLCQAILDVGEGITCGIADGVVGATAIIHSPFQTIKGMRNVTVEGINLTNDLFKLFWYQNCYTGSDQIEIVTEIQDRLQSRVDHAEKMWHQLKKLPLKEQVRFATSLATDFYLSGKVNPIVFKQISKVCKNAHTKTVQYLEKFTKSEKAVEVATTAGKTEVKLASQAEKVTELEAKITQTAQKTDTVIQKGRKAAESCGKITKPAKQAYKAVNQAKRSLSEFVTFQKTANGNKLIANMEKIMETYAATFKKLGLNAPTKDFIKHVANKHYKMGQKFIRNLAVNNERFSVFTESENFIELALKVMKYGQRNGREIIFDAGRTIGFNTTGKPTSIVKVFLNETGKKISSIYPL